MSEKLPELIWALNKSYSHDQIYILHPSVVPIAHPDLKPDEYTPFILKSKYDEQAAEIEKLKAELEKVKDVNEWISVDERLPENTDSVLIFGQSIRSSGLFMDGEFHSDFKLPEHKNVSHWMPLPNMPKKPTK